jgi:hypothetical protein
MATTNDIYNVDATTTATGTSGSIVSTSSIQDFYSQYQYQYPPQQSQPYQPQPYQQPFQPSQMFSEEEAKILKSMIARLNNKRNSSASYISLDEAIEQAIKELS